MICRNCGKPIEAMETPIDDFFVHMGSRLQACSIFISGQWAEPEE